MNKFTYGSYARSAGLAGIGLYGSAPSMAMVPRRRKGTSYGKRVSKRPRVSRVSFKKMVYGVEEAKHFTYENSLACLHNVIYTNCPTQGIVQGTDYKTRIGDEIYISKLNIHGTAVASTAANAFKYRIIVGWTGEEVTGSDIGTVFPIALTTSQIFQPNTTTLFTTNGLINSKAISVVHDQTIDLNSQITGTADWRTFTASIPLDTVFQYQSSGSVFGKTKNLVVIATAVVAGGTNSTSSCGSIVLSCDLVFKG